ncbi:MAG: UDP-glucose/GDP-mannose dehydrogenase family protein [Cyanobacteriota bacterium]
MEVCVTGTGYVGLVTGVCLAYLGNNVNCVDIDAKKVEKLQQGIPTFYEPGLEELLKICIKSGNIKFTTDTISAVKKSEVVFIAVGTPPLEDGEPNLEYVKNVSYAIGEALDTDRVRIIINKSTVPIGSGNWVEMLVNEGVRKAHEKCSKENNINSCCNPGFLVASNPEFLREGSAIYDTLYPDRVVIGTSDERAVIILNKLYEPILQQNFTPPIKELVAPAGINAVPLVVTDITSAEMIKYASNAFLATKISFINEVANICESVGADIEQVAKGIGLDSRIGGKFLKAGIGWGGSCFGKDLNAIISIAKEYDFHPELLQSTINVNMKQRQTIVKKLQQALKIIKGRTIGVLGLSFKPNTDDLRDAPSLTIIRQLIKMGARVKAYDPIAMPNCKEQNPELELTYENNIMDLAKDCEAIIIVTEWDEFKYMNLIEVKEVMAIPIIIDARNIIDPKTAKEKGILHYTVGRSTEMERIGAGIGF